MPKTVLAAVVAAKMAAAAAAELIVKAAAELMIEAAAVAAALLGVPVVGLPHKGSRWPLAGHIQGSSRLLRMCHRARPAAVAAAETAVAAVGTAVAAAETAGGKFVVRISAEMSAPTMYSSSAAAAANLTRI